MEMLEDLFLEAKRERDKTLTKIMGQHKELSERGPFLYLVPEVDPNEFPSVYKRLTEEETARRAGKISANVWFAYGFSDEVYFRSALQAFSALEKKATDRNIQELIKKCIDFCERHLEGFENKNIRLNWPYDSFL